MFCTEIVVPRARAEVSAAGWKETPGCNSQAGTNNRRKVRKRRIFCIYNINLFY